MNATERAPSMTRAAGAATIDSGPPALIVGVQTVRRSGGPFFLLDVAFLSDARFRALARRLPDPDDFNSAVGAWAIALAAARRNGRPEIDAGTETGSRFLPELLTVGLLIEEGFRPEPFKAWAPMSPQQASAGRARALSGNRDDAGRFTSALDTLERTVQPSLPLPSNQVSSTEEGVQGGKPDPFETFYRRTGQIPGTKLRSWLNELADKYGDARLAARIAETPMAGTAPEYLKAVGDGLALEEHRAERAEAADEKRRNEEKRRPIVIAESPVEVSEEEAKRQALEYMAEFPPGHGTVGRP